MYRNCRRVRTESSRHRLNSDSNSTAAVLNFNRRSPTHMNRSPQATLTFYLNNPLFMYDVIGVNYVNRALDNIARPYFDGALGVRVSTWCSFRFKSPSNPPNTSGSLLNVSASRRANH